MSTETSRFNTLEQHLNLESQKTRADQSALSHWSDSLETTDTTNWRLTQRTQKAQSPTCNTFSCGDTHNLALTSDGQVLMWGHEQTLAPTLIDLDNIQSVAAGGMHSLALTEAQTVLSWGDNSLKQLGHFCKNPKQALEVRGLSNVQGIQAGSVHSLASHTNGTVSTWGNNLFGQLGVAPLSAPFDFAQVARLDRVREIRAGLGHSLALTGSGQVFAWGANDLGQLGIGTNADSYQPTKITLPMPIVAIQTGMYHSAALTNDGRVLTWGRGYRNVANRPFFKDSYRSLPTAVPEFGRMASIAAGHGFMVARSRQGSVFVWNQHRVWNRKFSPSSHQPTKVAGLEEIVAIDAGSAHVLALRADGTLLAWGDNSFGQLGTMTQSTWVGLPCPVVLPKRICLRMPF
jgi:alpha-tubulin suppressor-like RCC1 family protein